MISKWPIYNLDELYTISSGLSKKREEFGFGYPFLTFKEVFHNTFVPDILPELANTTDKERENCSIKRGDVFLTRTSEKLEELGLSSVALKDYPSATFNGFTKRLRPNKKCVELLIPEYVAFYLRSNEFRNQVTSFASMTTRASLNNEMISKLTIKVPPLAIQKHIASIMVNLFLKEESNKKTAQLLEQIAQTLFKHWFIDFEFPNEEGLPYKTSGGTMVESELGAVPKDWGIFRSDHICTINIGKTPPRKEFHWFSESEGVKWVSISDLKSEAPYIFFTKEFLTGDAIEKHNVKVVPKDTVILSFKLTVGRVGITSEQMVTNEAIAHFNIKNTEQMTKEYLYCYLKAFNYENLGSTSSIATAVNSKIIKAMPVIIPCKRVLEKFNELVLPVFEMIRQVQIESNKLTEAEDYLLPRFLSGEIEIPIESMVD